MARKTSKSIKPSVDKDTGDWFFSLEDLADLVDIDKVVYYSIEVQENNSILLKLYDKDKKPCACYAPKN